MIQLEGDPGEMTDEARQEKAYAPGSRPGADGPPDQSGRGDDNQEDLPW